MKEKKFFPRIKDRENAIESNEIPEEENHEEKKESKKKSFNSKK